VFDEFVFSFASLNPNAGKRFQKEILLLPLDTPFTLGDANIDDYMPLPVVPNVHPVISELVAPDDQVNGANDANASTEEDGENLANTDARHVVHRDVQVDMHGTGADPDLGTDFDSAASCGSARASSSPPSSPGRSRSTSLVRGATSSTCLFPAQCFRLVTYTHDADIVLRLRHLHPHLLRLMLVVMIALVGLTGKMMILCLRLHLLLKLLNLGHAYRKVYDNQNNILMVLFDMVCLPL
jgi:hypothetical protein